MSNDPIADILFGETSTPTSEAPSPVEQKTEPTNIKAPTSQQGEGMDIDASSFDTGEVELDPNGLHQFASLAQEHGLNQEAAQDLLDFYIQKHQEQQGAWEDYQQQQIEEAKNDSEIGGSRFEASVRAAKSVLKTHGTPELMEALSHSGMGNNKEVIRFLARIAGGRR